MRTEKLPSSYKYFVKRYFAKIHPTTEATTSEPESAPPTATPSERSDPSSARSSAPAPEDKTR